MNALKATSLGLLATSLLLVGCGGDDNAVDEMVAAPAPAAQGTSVATPAAVAPPVAAPPEGSAAQAAAPIAGEKEAPDLFQNYKVSADGSPNKTDVEALQAVVDAYAFGPDGLGAPVLNTLDDLVTRGYLKRLPPPPQGMKWAYDSPKWKVSVVPQ